MTTFFSGEEWQVWGSHLLAVLVMFHAAFFLAVRRRDLSVIDQFWGPSLAWAGVWSWWVSGDGATESSAAVSVLLVIWAARLSLYIGRRSRQWGREDARYAKWRTEWGERASAIAYRRVFMLQAAISLWVSAPLVAAGVVRADRLSVWGWWDGLALSIMFVGILWEAIADAQKASFKAKTENSKRVMQTGLWKYSRHPNYFGEILLWWGVSLWIALSGVPWWWALVPGLTMNVLLLKVSGVAMLESTYKDRPEFAAYRARTNALIPWWPRANSDRE